MVVMNATTKNYQASAQRLRVCSYNIHKGFNAINSRFLLNNIRQAIQLSHADIVFLQEVIGENHRHADIYDDWIPEAQFEFLADTVWPHHAYGRNAIYDHGHHGNAILSRIPLLEHQNYDLSLLPRSHRGVLHTRTAEKVHLFCLHFGLLSQERQMQTQRLIRIIDRCTRLGEAVIIAGDFNDWNNRLSKQLKEALDLEDALSIQYGKPPATFPAIKPLLPVDRIYFRGLKLINAEVLMGHPWNKLSDHCAVVADFERC